MTGYQSRFSNDDQLVADKPRQIENMGSNCNKLHPREKNNSIGPSQTDLEGPKLTARSINNRCGYSATSV
jgi:hypothetical protein